MIYDASDLCLGDSEAEDFERCVGEVCHIRSALRLSTQSSKRRARAPPSPSVFAFAAAFDDGEEDKEDECSDSSSDAGDEEAS